MPSLFDVTDDAQHAKCYACVGAKNDCLTLIQCSYSICGLYCHVDCLPATFDKTKLDSEEFWYCKKECRTLHEPDRTLLEAKKIPGAAAAIKILEKRLSETQLHNDAISKQRDEAMHAAEVLDKSRMELLEKNKKMESDLSIKMFTSSFAQGTSQAALQSHYSDASSIRHSTAPPATASLESDSLAKLLERVKHIEISKDRQQDDSSNSNPFALSSGTFSADDLSQAHAIASLTLTLSERRKQLPKLPDFDGKGAEWLHFRNIYRALRSEGKYDNREMNAKLTCALKGPALDFTRLWLYSSRPNPDKIIQDLEDRFFSPVAVMTDTLEVVNDFPPIKEKNRNALELFKRAVDGYINICTDVDEVAPLLIRIPESAEDKMPDDLIERWNRKIRHKIFKGNWFDFSNFLLESTFDLKVRASDRKKLLCESTKDSKSSKTSSHASATVHVVSSQPASSCSSTSSVISNSNSEGQSSDIDSTRPRLVGAAPPCDYDSCGKPLYRCEGFAKRAFDIKNAHVQMNGYCSRCIRKGHDANTCPNEPHLPQCKMKGCSDPSTHTTIMHPPELTED